MRSRPAPAPSIFSESVLDIRGLGEVLHEGLYITDRDRRIQYWNPAAEQITGFTAADVVGRRCADNILIHVDAGGCALCVRGCPLAATMDDLQPRQANVYLHHKRGHRVPVLVRAQPLLDARGSAVGAIEVFSDASPLDALRARIASLEALALVDPLTDIPNRRYVESQIASQLSLFQRTGVEFGVALFDIDGFKRINDEHGHLIGDITLQTVSRTLSATVRTHDTVGRWGGEEFIVVMPQTGVVALEAIAQRLCRMVGLSRVHLGTRSFSVTLSGGATLVGPSDTADRLIARADALMYAAKRAGGDRVHV